MYMYLYVCLCVYVLMWMCACVCVYVEVQLWYDILVYRNGYYRFSVQVLQTILNLRIPLAHWGIYRHFFSALVACDGICAFSSPKHHLLWPVSLGLLVIIAHRHLVLFCLRWFELFTWDCTRKSNVWLKLVFYQLRKYVILIFYFDIKLKIWYSIIHLDIYCMLIIKSYLLLFSIGNIFLLWHIVLARTQVLLISLLLSLHNSISLGHVYIHMKSSLIS